VRGVTPCHISSMSWASSRHRPGERLAHIACAALRAHQFPGVAARAVLVQRCEYLVTGLQIKGAGDDVDAKGRVVDKDDILRTGADVGGQRHTRRAQRRDGLFLKETHWLAFDAALPLLIHVEDWSRRGAKGAVVEKNDIRVKLKVLAKAVHRFLISTVYVIERQSM
jgi:hypothetical protein